MQQRRRHPLKNCAPIEFSFGVSCEAVSLDACSHRVGAEPVSCPVLLIDDDVDSVQAFVLFLHYHGIDAVTAADGEAALQLLRSGLVPCVIILDLMMPGKDGFAFRSEQLRDGALARIPVIVCSAAYD